MKKISVLIIVLAAFAAMLTACGGGDTDEQIRIALVTGTGGLGDESFNDMAADGLREAEETYGIYWTHSTPPSNADFEAHILAFAEAGTFDLIIVTSFAANSAMTAVAPEFPDQNFAIVDTIVELPNVRTIFKDFPEMTFLGGYLAGLMTADPSIDRINPNAQMVGIVLGSDTATQMAAARGFVAGATLANPNVDAQIRVVGSFADPTTALEISRGLYGEGADILMSFAGGSGAGVTQAAAQEDLFVIPGSFLRIVDEPNNSPAAIGEHLTMQVMREVSAIVNGTWAPGVFIGTLANDYVGIVFEGSNVALPQYILDRVEAVRLRAVRGEISIPATLDEIPAWAAANRR